MGIKYEGEMDVQDNNEGSNHEHNFHYATWKDWALIKVSLAISLVFFISFIAFFLCFILIFGSSKCGSPLL